MMHGHEKSDRAIVAVKPANEADQSIAERSATDLTAAEPAEQRAGTKGNAEQQSTCRTQCRESVSQALERIRHVALQRMEFVPHPMLGGLALIHPRQEPSARIGPARICAGGAQ